MASGHSLEDTKQLIEGIRIAFERVASLGFEEMQQACMGEDMESLHLWFSIYEQLNSLDEMKHRLAKEDFRAKLREVRDALDHFGHLRSQGDVSKRSISLPT